MLTRANLEQRLNRVAALCELFATRKTTSRQDQAWATDAIATLAAIPREGTGDAQNDETTRTMPESGDVAIVDSAGASREQRRIDDAAGEVGF